MIKAIVFDVDGTLTDGSINIGPSGESFKRFDVKDGYAIHSLLPKYGIIPIIITGRTSEIVKIRCKELNIDYLFQGMSNKKKKLEDIASELNICMNDVAYIGDDVNDLDCMNMVGTSACPSDAVAEVISTCDYVCKSPGGHGAVREFIEWIIKNRLNP